MEVEGFIKDPEICVSELGGRVEAVSEMRFSVRTPHFEWSFPMGKHFNCERCGNCCRFPNVYLWPEDIVRISAYLLNKGLRQIFDEFFDPETHRLHKVGGKCIFLMEVSEKPISRGGLGITRCFVYPVRPLYCRAFPWKLRDLENGLIQLLDVDFCSGVSKGKIHRAELLELDPYLRDLADLEAQNIKVIREPSG